LNPVNKKDYSVSIGKAGIYAIPIALLSAAAVLLPYAVIWGRAGFYPIRMPEILLFAGAVLAGIILHELIHAASWIILSGKSRRIISFGFHLRTFTPYVHCREPIKAGAYKLGALMPALILGILPSLIAILNGDLLLMFFGLIFTSAASGDFLIIWILRSVKSDCIVEDHPTQAGCFVYEKQS